MLQYFLLGLQCFFSPVSTLAFLVLLAVVSFCLTRDFLFHLLAENEHDGTGTTTKTEMV